MDKETFLYSCNFSLNHNSQSYEGCQVEYIEDPDSFTYSEFFRRFLLSNSPCVLSARFTDGWGSRRCWVSPRGKPNFDHLLQNFGDAIVPVANCDVKEYNANPKEQIPLREYITYWKDYIQNNYCSPKGCLYLKDWHMHRAFPDKNIYSTLVYFTSDWLNEYWDAIAGDDYRFVYMGPKGSWTPFHSDVFRSYSWSVNICGRKKWLLFPPGQEEYLRDRHGQLAYDVTLPDLQDSCLYPHSAKGCQPLEVIQEAGETIFIPSGWHHQVHNMEDTISINHNWVNGCSVTCMWHFLQCELKAVKQEIGEWRETMDDWHQHCQVVMKSCTGIDYKEFYLFLKVIAENRIRFLEEYFAGRDISTPSLSKLGPLHALYDLGRTADVLAALIANEDFKQLETESFSPAPLELLHHSQAVIDDTYRINNL
ncbi:2-oxoglutarate and iron-dependent oxygenase JMJD4 [Microcaecilia unicolor]|uniref:2-oxoglutarate and iron-dependent oxygenase JMJD4 n=1 Tax=Microcaecilia unicolor TaxID=1415580 RepID=A0A6P7WRE8_9AMPH|nr:2-oxoglutarate and iron-dependent oxygenase JMJD4 [Microcaecilia unicolor]